MTSVRHWLNLERGRDPLKTASAAWVLLPYLPSPLPYHPQVPPIGASALAEQVLGSSRAWKQVILGLVSSPGQGRHALVLATFYLD